MCLWLKRFSVGKYSVPVLWDKKKKCIVNNESAEIVRMFNSAFSDLAKHPELNLYPEHLTEQIDAVNAWVYPTINNGVYRCGFAQSQQAYDKAFTCVRNCPNSRSFVCVSAGSCLRVWTDVKRFCQNRDTWLEMSSQKRTFVSSARSFVSMKFMSFTSRQTRKPSASTRI